MLEKIQFAKNLDKFKECFSLAFEKRFGSKPLIEQEDDVHFRWAIDKLGLEKANELIECYFLLEDEWLKNQGFPISLFRKQINRVIASNGVFKHISRPVYVVGYSESGYPIHSNNPQYLKEEFPKWKPVLWNIWVEQSINEKFQIPKSQWATAGNKVDDWIALWIKEGWAKTS